MKVIIAGGGTGGHLFPGIAVAREIQRRYAGSKILFVGAQQGIETKIVPKEGFELRTLPVGGIKEKVLAARRHGITEVILPRQNEKHIKEDLTDELRRELTIHYVQHIEEVLGIALLPSATQTHTAVPIEELRQTVQ